MPEHPPSCPRCGYDQSGVMASWTDSCPLHGTCSECGLGFEWRNILNPLFTLPPWSFEHAPAWSLSALARTAVRTLMPQNLWSQLRMEHPIHARRLIELAVLGAVFIHFLTLTGPFVLWSVGEWLNTGVLMASQVGLSRLIVSNYWPYHTGLDEYFYPSWPSPGAWPGFMDPWPGLAWIWWAVMPFTFLLLPITLRRCRVRGVHLFRIGAYSLVFAALAVLVSTRMSMLLMGCVQVCEGGLGRGGWSMSSQTAGAIDFWSKKIFYTLSPTATGILIAVFWSFAAGRYLKLPRPWLVGFTLVLLGGLGAVLIASFVPGYMTDLFKNT